MRKLVYLILLLSVQSCTAPNTPKEAKQEPFCRDLDDIKAAGKLRALTDGSSTSYFIYKGNPIGFEYALLKRFTKELGVNLDMIVVENLDSIEVMLDRGEGDIIAANYNITDLRKSKLDFTQPIFTSDQVIVQAIPIGWDTLSQTQREQWQIDSISDLYGRTVTVRKGSSFHEELLKLKNQGIPISIELSDESTEDLIKQVADGQIELTVADENVAKLNMTYYPNLIASISIAEDLPVAWAMRAQAPALLDSANRWLSKFKSTRAFAAIQLKYFKARSQHRLKVLSSYSSLGGDQISPYDDLFKHEAKHIGWDWMLLAAMVRKESNFNPSVESIAGAKGLMQLLPSTGAHFGADSLSDPAQNIRAGVAFIEAVMERWEADSLDTLNQIKFVLASYNAGVAHIKDAQALAVAYGANGNDWEEVSPYLLKLSIPKYYNHEVVKYGYCKGIQAYQYVDRVMEYWGHYRTGFK